MSVSTKGFICHSNFNLLMLKHTKSLEKSDIPSLEMPDLLNTSIKSYMMCPNMLKPKYICLFPQKVSFVTVTLPN